MKSFVSIIELDITNDFVFDFHLSVGIIVAPIYEPFEIVENSYFKTVYGVNIDGRDLMSLENIGSITIDADRGYTRVFSFKAGIFQEKSFYVYEENKIKYIAIHLKNFDSHHGKEINSNIKSLYSKRSFINEEGFETLYFNGDEVLPIIEEIDTADIEGDALTFDTLQMSEMSVTLLNVKGRFDNFDNLYGNRFLVHKVYDGEGESTSKVVFSGFIEKPEFNFLDTVTITASDIRHSYSTELPYNSFNENDYPHLLTFPENVESREDLIGTKRTLCAGHGIIVKCTPIKYYTGSNSEVIFEICDTTHFPIERIVMKKDKLDNNKIKPHVFFIEKATSEDDSLDHNGMTITGDIETFIDKNRWTLDKAKGALTFSGANNVKSITIGDNSDELIEIFVEIDMSPYKSLAFMRICLFRYENIAYIKENYDLENWNKEESNSKEIAVILDNDNSKTILDLLGEISFLEQGRLEIIDNKITWNDTNERVIKLKLNQNKMGRIDKTVESGEYLSSCSIKYDLGKSTHENKTYERKAKKKHRLNSHEEFETLLKHKEDAIELSEKIMKARYTLAYYYTFEYFETLDNLKLFDLVEMSYKRESGKYFVAPCMCEVVKLNIFDNIIKLRSVYTK